jgi:hypothetical protein
VPVEESKSRGMVEAGSLLLEASALNIHQMKIVKIFKKPNIDPKEM